MGQTPSSKLQTPGKLQVPSSRTHSPVPLLGIWGLGFLWSLELGLWSLHVRGRPHGYCFQLTTLSLLAPVLAFEAGSIILSGPADQTVTGVFASKNGPPVTGVVVLIRPFSPRFPVASEESCDTFGVQ